MTNTAERAPLKITLSRRRILRAVLVAVWIGLGVVLFITSRGHTVLMDNRNIPSLDIQAPDLITVSVDGAPPLEFLRGDRDRLTLGGTSHRIQVTFSNGAPAFEGTFRLPLRDDTYILSIPRLIQGIDPAVEVFRSVPESRTPDEEELPGLEEMGM
jgi:hypothetical protein